MSALGPAAGTGAREPPAPIDMAPQKPAHCGFCVLLFGQSTQSSRKVLAGPPESSPDETPALGPIDHFKFYLRAGSAAKMQASQANKSICLRGEWAELTHAQVAATMMS